MSRESGYETDRLGHGCTQGARIVPVDCAGPGQHGAHDRGRGRQGGYRETAEGLWAGHPGDCHPLKNRCLAGGVCDGSCGPAVGDPRVPEEVQVGRQDAEG